MKKRTHFGVPPTARQRAQQRGEEARPIDLELQRREAREHQRQQQQGLGNPIISAEFRGQRFVAVGNVLLHSPRWTTFHDFLIDYGRRVLGTEWWLEEAKKPTELRHSAVRWFESLSAAPAAAATGMGRPMTGGVAAYLRLAYDLYCLKHNTVVRDRLVQRLKDRGNFVGARYEVFVAAAFVRAGFLIEFENEDDPSTSHCEFTATHKVSGKQFSVEAKYCVGAKRIGRRLTDALRKSANHPRVVFIDLNEPDGGPSGAEMPEFLRHALEGARRFERSRPGMSLPRAYVFITNHPSHHHLENTAFRNTLLVEGFHIPEFKGDAKFPSLRAAIDARDAHIEMERLAVSIRDHSDVPGTFDGEAPELAYEASEARLRIGDRYLVPDGNGLLVPGLLESATVVESERVAYGSYALDDGRRVIVTAPLTEAEIAAYRRHPDTFFGVVQPAGKQITDPIELYDFIFSTYSKSPREKLLEFMAGWPDIERLRALAQPDLARAYAEGCVYATMALPKGRSSPDGAGGGGG